MSTVQRGGIPWPWRRSAPRRLRPQPETLRLFERAAANLQLAAEHVDDRLSEWPEDRGLREEITRCEHEGDLITHEIIRGLLEARLTPYERGGVHALAEAIDDVVDGIEEVSEELSLYAIEAPMEQAQELASVLRSAARAVRTAVDNFSAGADVEQEYIEVRDLEHQGDRIYRQGLVALFDGGIDPMLVIRWKDIFEGLEDAVDRSRQAMDILRNLSLRGSGSG